jgi:hypothetical protein
MEKMGINSSSVVKKEEKEWPAQGRDDEIL